MQAIERIWLNGRLVQWADATVHVASHGLHYGSGVLEGVRAYETAGGSAIFRLTGHVRRLHESARLRGMRLPSVAHDAGPVTKVLRDEYLRCMPTGAVASDRQR